jgi:hypothetical protein
MSGGRRPSALGGIERCKLAQRNHDVSMHFDFCSFVGVLPIAEQFEMVSAT